MCVTLNFWPDSLRLGMRQAFHHEVKLEITRDYSILLFKELKLLHASGHQRHFGEKKHLYKAFLILLDTLTKTVLKTNILRNTSDLSVELAGMNELQRVQYSCVHT